MFDIDSAVMDNFGRVIKAYTQKCEQQRKADCLYRFEVVVKDATGIPVGKIIVDRNCIQKLPVGEKEK